MRRNGNSTPTSPIQINERLRPQVIVEAFATVLLQLDLLDPHRLGDLTLLLPHTDAVCQVPIHSDREPLLGDLVACREVCVEVVLPVKQGLLVDVAVQSQACHHRCLHTAPVENRQSSRQRRIKKRNQRIWRCCKADFSSREQFRVGRNLGMNFQTYHSCPFLRTFPRLLGRVEGLLSH